MIGVIAPYVAKIRRSYQSNDIIDRLNYHYTALIVMIGAITLAATQYVGKPIQCWVPAQFTGSWERYAETFCFIKGSYYLPMDDNIGSDFIERDDAVIGYYQWVPIVLAVQAFLFYLPSLVWKALNFNTGINVKSILVSAAQIKKKIDKESRDDQVKRAAHHIEEALDMQRELKSDSCDVVKRWRKSGHYLSFLYIGVKLLYVLNIFVQFAIFKMFLGTKSTFWGWEVLNDIRSGREWEETGNFPRVTMCDFNVRVMGNLHRWTVQCVLMINMFTEKIYVFLWFWFLLVGVFSVVSLVYWLASLVMPSSQREFVSKYLRCNGAIPESSGKDDAEVSRFVKNFLTPDGVFLSRLIQTNGGDLLAGEIVTELYKAHQRRQNVSIDSPNTSQ
ncbi:unnamed protein product, partial [Mesorhabditis spiculigera]